MLRKNLIRAVKPSYTAGTFCDAGLTIADALFYSGIDYAYEKDLLLGEDGMKIPGFTIEDVNRGTIFYENLIRELIGQYLL